MTSIKTINNDVCYIVIYKFYFRIIIHVMLAYSNELQMENEI